MCLSCDVPEECDVLARHLLQFVERGGLPREAVVGVVVGHDGGGADLAQFVLWALQAAPHGVQIALPSEPHYRQRQGRGKKRGYFI